MALNFDEMRKAVAIRHDVLIGQDDPLLIEATMIENLLEQCVDTLNTQQAVNVKALIAAVQQGITEGKKAAKGILTEGADYVSDQAHNAIKATMDEGREELRKDIRHAWNKVEEARKASIVWAALSGIFALISVVANYVF